MKHETKLTSVKVLRALYEQFKFKTVNSNMNLQKLVNRSIELYLTDVQLKEQVEVMDTILHSYLPIIGDEQRNNKTDK